MQVPVPTALLFEKPAPPKANRGYSHRTTLGGRAEGCSPNLQKPLKTQTLRPSSAAVEQGLHLARGVSTDPNPTKWFIHR